MDNIEENPFAYILSKLAIARYEQTKEQLIELEDELRTVNRFFPDTIITRKIDTLIDAPHKVLKKGQIVYRCRLIDKFHEQDFLKGCYDDLINKIRQILRFPYLVYGKEDYDYCNKKDLIALGYGTSFAVDIIRESKNL